MTEVEPPGGDPTDFEVSELRKQAETGDADAQRRLGLALWPLDEGEEWLAKAAEQGHAEAQCVLAERLMPGVAAAWEE